MEKIFEFIDGMLPPAGFFFLTCWVLWFLYRGFEMINDNAKEILEKLERIEEKLDKDD